MPLELSIAGESDISAITALLPLAFSHDLPYRAIFPHGPTPEYLAHYTAVDTEEYRHSTTLNYLKVVDSTLDSAPSATPTNSTGDTNSESTVTTSTSNIVGFAAWHIYGTQTPEQLAEKATHRFPDGANAELGSRFMDNGTSKRHEIMGGKPYVFLAILGTHPSHHGRGAGALCMRWGTEVADKLGVPCYLEATAAGEPLYRRWGFEEVERLRIELGEGKVVWHRCMVRGAREGEGGRKT